MEYSCAYLGVSGSSISFEIASPRLGVIQQFLFCLTTAVTITNITSITRIRYIDQVDTAEMSVPGSVEFLTGNIPSFLYKDPYYPSHSVGSRYSSIYPNSAVQDTQNCILIRDTAVSHEYSYLYTVQLDNPITDPGNNEAWVGFLTSDDLVSGSKHGFICDKPTISSTCDSNTEQPTHYGSCIALSTDDCYPQRSGNKRCYTGIKDQYEVCTIIRNMNQQYQNRNIGPGIVKTFIPNLLMKHTRGIGVEDYVRINETVYNEAVDPRAPNDKTRRTGILPKCSAETCFDSMYVAQGSNAQLPIHDQVYSANIALEIARRLLTNCTID
ncbi:hypothetical protein GPJ56_005041 [Histomonas meleagridis]|uniref:uncharacterized protein n=1 Tax=Histomonas meleagridis TaxID=135588 RepID=UPI003559D99D|nr:hypothetical protein GPJ56_005041 [Histomonas meleagridis]KAH0802558.1 hypothetical protein GO595_004607 [Histomonas meleagridis]